MMMVNCKFLAGHVFVFIQEEEHTVADMIVTLRSRCDTECPKNTDVVIIANGAALDEEELLSGILFNTMECVHVVVRPRITQEES